jgi:hypothetical protein
MLHLQPVTAPDSPPEPYAEAVSRLASVRHALRLVDDHGGGPADDVPDAALAASWAEAAVTRRQLFDRRSAATVQAAAAGLEALLVEQGDGRRPHEEASRLLVEEIRRELAAVSRTLLR